MAWECKIKLGVGLSALIIGLSVPSAASIVDRPFFRASAMVVVLGATDFMESGGEALAIVDFHLLDNASSGTVAPDLIAADGRTINYNTGDFHPAQGGDDSGWKFQLSGQTSGGGFTSTGPHQTLDANDSYAPFGLDQNTDIDLQGSGQRTSLFFVASNVPFDLFAQASNFSGTGDFAGLGYQNIRYRLAQRVSGGSGATRWGNNAQNPANGGSGIVLGGSGGTNWTLAHLQAGPTKVFDGGRRTARNPGSLLSQMVGFKSTYSLRKVGVTGNNYDFSMGSGKLSADVTYTVYTP